MAQEAYRREEPRNASGAQLTIVALGDAAIFVLFAAVGRASHHEHAGIAHTIRTALPFLVGWFLAAFAWRTYRSCGLRSYRTGLPRVLGAAITGIAIALATRSILEHRLVPPGFTIIAFGFNGVLLATWRAAVIALLRTRHS